MRLYVASSWRTPTHPELVRRLREAGHLVYDYRQPHPNAPFKWSEIDGDWQAWTPSDYLQHLHDPRAVAAYRTDMTALESSDTVVLVLPCGRSAHLELGYAVGAGKPTFILLEEGCEPELMYRMASGIFTDIEVLLAALEQMAARIRGPFERSMAG